MIRRQFEEAFTADALPAVSPPHDVQAPPASSRAPHPAHALDAAFRQLRLRAVVVRAGLRGARAPVLGLHLQSLSRLDSACVGAIHSTPRRRRRRLEILAAGGGVVSLLPE